MRDDPDPGGNLAWARAIAKADALVALSHEVRASAEKRARFKQAAGAYADPRSRASRTTHERERAAEGVAKEMGVEVPVAAQGQTPAEPVEATASSPLPRSTAKHTAKTGTLGTSASFKSDGSDASVGDSATAGTAGGGAPQSSRKQSAILKPQKQNSGDVLDMWDEKGNIRVAKALADTPNPSDVDPSSKEVSITPDQYRLLYLISRLQSVSFEAPRKMGSIELTRNEISTGGGGSPSRTSSEDSLDRLQSLAARECEEREGDSERERTRARARTRARGRPRA